MKPLILLIASFSVCTGISKLITGTWNIMFAGNLAMCLMLCFTAMGHFLFTRGMSMMIPGHVPGKTELVYLSGVAEIVLGMALVFPASRTMAAYIIIGLFILMLPANIFAAAKHLDMEKGTYTGPGLRYLFFRIPLQILFIAWVYYFSLRPVS